MSPTDLSQATPSLYPSFPCMGAGWSPEGGALEKGQFGIPYPGPPGRFPGLSGSPSPPH